LRLPSPRTCFLVYPRQHLNKPAVKLFRDWLFDELRDSPPVFCKP
jgi:DNA-binding transcriptional LysR family regulator